MLHRLFPWTPGAPPSEPGGALFNPRRQQGSGRHDQPQAYGALYFSRSELSPLAEWLAAFRGQGLEATDLQRTDGRRWALASFDDSALGALPDLDEPAQLLQRDLRPSQVATHRRPVTQHLAASLFAEGLPGFCWWSTLESSWSNVTLFAERALPSLRLAGQPREVSIGDPLLIAAATAVGVRIDAPAQRARQ